MTLKITPKITKMKPETSSTNNIFQYNILLDFSEIMALVFLKISEFLDTVDKLYISRFFAIRRCKPRKTTKIVTIMHPEPHQSPTNSTLEKATNLGIDFGMILTSKMFPK